MPVHPKLILTTLAVLCGVSVLTDAASASDSPPEVDLEELIDDIDVNAIAQRVKNALKKDMGARLYQTGDDVSVRGFTKDIEGMVKSNASRDDWQGFQESMGDRWRKHSQQYYPWQNKVQSFAEAASEDGPSQKPDWQRAQDYYSSYWMDQGKNWAKKYSGANWFTNLQNLQESFQLPENLKEIFGEDAEPTIKITVKFDIKDNKIIVSGDDVDVNGRPIHEWQVDLNTGKVTQSKRSWNGQQVLVNKQDLTSSGVSRSVRSSSQKKTEASMVITIVCIIILFATATMVYFFIRRERRLANVQRFADPDAMMRESLSKKPSDQMTFDRYSSTSGSNKIQHQKMRDLSGIQH